MRLIDSDELLNDLIFPTEQFKRAFTELINDSPTIEAEPVKHGKWIEDEYGFLICSECGNTAECVPFLGQIKSPYCNECGAKMDEVEK